MKYISFTDCNTDTTQKLSVVVSTTIELKNITSVVTRQYRTLVSRNIPRWMPLLSNIVVTFFSSIVVLALNGQFLDCVTVTFSERHVANFLLKYINNVNEQTYECRIIPSVET